MRAARLYGDDARAAVEHAEPLMPSRDCTRCELHTSATRPCIGPEGRPGGLLVVGMYPGAQEDAAGRPCVGVSGAYLRSAISATWSGPVALDNAVKCSTHAGAVKDAHVRACRPYLARALMDARPERIIALGGVAAQGLLGRSVPTMLVRRGYAYLSTGVPVFVLPHPARMLGNRFEIDEFEADLRWACTCELPERAPLGGVTYLVGTPEDAAEAAEALLAAPWVAYDCETTGLLGAHDFGMLCVALSTPGGESYVWTEDALFDDACADQLRRVLTAPDVGKVAHHEKYDRQACMQALCCEPAPLHLDTQLARGLLSPGTRTNLDQSADLVGMGGHKDEAAKLVDKAKRRLRKDDREAGLPPRANYDAYAYARLPADVLHRYCARDAVATARLAVMLEPSLGAQPALRRVWDQVLGPATWAVGHVERWGIAVDKDAVLALSAHLRSEIAALDQRFASHGADFNPGSNQQIAAVLYGRGGYKLPITRRTKGGAPSTDADALAEITAGSDAAAAGFAADILSRRSMVKLLGTYADGLLSWIRRSGRVHPSYRLDGAASGRISCSAPNLQNIPRPSDPRSKLVRDCYVAEPGNVLVQGDLSQIELRIAAALSDDPDMIAVYERGEDLHMFSARQISRLAWGIEPDEVTKEHRAQAKALVSFGLLYGKSDETLAADTGSTVDAAARVRAAVLGRFAKLGRWINDQKRHVHQHGGVYTWWDGKPARWRPLYDVASRDSGRKGHAERAAVNTPIQGTASDFCLAALADVVRWLLGEAFPAKLVLTVHDSIMLEVAETHADEAAERLRAIMEARPAGPVPVVADIEIGYRWGSLTPYVAPSEIAQQVA